MHELGAKNNNNKKNQPTNQPTKSRVKIKSRIKSRTSATEQKKKRSVEWLRRAAELAV
jgi:hypothetical protein